MQSPRNVLLILLLLVMTVAYSWFIQLAMTMFNLFLASWKITALPIFSVLTAKTPLPWQVMAFAFLLINLGSAFFRSRARTETGLTTTVAILHTVYLFTCLIVHGIGFLLPFIAPDCIIE